jgi:hypothetical protein
MFCHVPKVLVVIGIAVVLMPTAVNAECVTVTPKMLRDAPSSELVFAGTVVEVTRTGEWGSRATFEVERIWRGKVPKRFDVYMWDLASPEAPRYERMGRSYVVIAKRLENQRAREGVGLGDSNAVAFAGLECSGGHSVEEFMRGVGPGKPPIDESVEGKIKR